MADAAPRGRGGFGSRGDRGGDRGRGRRGRGRRGGKQEEKEWQPVTKLGRLVKAGKITSMEQIYLHSLPVKEYQIVDFFLPKLKDEVMKVRHNRLRNRLGGIRKRAQFGGNREQHGIQSQLNSTSTLDDFLQIATLRATECAQAFFTFNRPSGTSD